MSTGESYPRLVNDCGFRSLAREKSSSSRLRDELFYEHTFTASQRKAPKMCRFVVIFDYGRQRVHQSPPPRRMHSSWVDFEVALSWSRFRFRRSASVHRVDLSVAGRRGRDAPEHFADTIAVAPARIASVVVRDRNGQMSDNSKASVVAHFDSFRSDGTTFTKCSMDCWSNRVGNVAGDRNARYYDTDCATDRHTADAWSAQVE